jgi:enoyl-CoA hydratase/carnithine racemase
MANSHVRYSVSDGIARITLNRPPVNALDLDMLRRVVQALRHASTDTSAKVVILESQVPGRFSAGLDLTCLASGSNSLARELLQELYIGLYDAQYDLGKPSIAVVNGTTRGGGMTMAVSCDVIIAASSATFGYPEINVGVLPAIHFVHLPRIVGRHRAFELLFSGRAFDAAEAQELGLVNRVVADADLDSVALDMALSFASKSPLVMRHGRAAFMRQNDLDYRRAIAAAVEDFCNGASMEDAREGLRAFKENRQPEWQQGPRR